MCEYSQCMLCVGRGEGGGGSGGREYNGCHHSLPRIYHKIHFIVYMALTILPPDIYANCYRGKEDYKNYKRKMSSFNKKYFAFIKVKFLSMFSFYYEVTPFFYFVLQYMLYVMLNNTFSLKIYFQT